MADCIICMCEIEPSTASKYKIHEEDEWSDSPVCLDCISYLQKSQWPEFLKQVDKADCRASVLRLCHKVPETVYDPVAFKCKQHGDECPISPQGSVKKLLKVEDNEEIEPFLEGAKHGDELIAYKEHLEKFAEYFEAEKTAENE